MNEIAKKRAELNDDNREWSPIDALEHAIERLKEKDLSKIHLFVAWREDLDECGGKIGWNSANCQRHDQIALIELLKFELCKEWFSE